VVVPEQVAQTVNRQAFQLGAQTRGATAPARGLDGDDDVAQLHVVPRRVSFAAQLLQVEAEHVGGAVVTAVSAVQRADLGVVREHQRRRRPRPPQRAQRSAHARGDTPAMLRFQQAPGAPAHQGRDRHG